MSRSPERPVDVFLERQQIKGNVAEGWICFGPQTEELR